MTAVLTILFVSCTVMSVIVHRQLKTLGRQSRTPSPTTIFDDPHMTVVDIGNVEWIELASTGNETTQTNTSEHSTIVRSIRIMDGDILSGTEIEGARPHFSHRIHSRRRYGLLRNHFRLDIFRLSTFRPVPVRRSVLDGALRQGTEFDPSLLRLADFPQ
jgi:hypothetical protein